MATRSDLSGGISLRFTAALERARELAERPVAGGRPAPLPHPRRRVRVIGDPQVSLERLMAVLDAHELLGVDGYLADDAQLVSLGDHLPEGGGDDGDGMALLRWLAEHAPAQVAILLGDLDVAALAGGGTARGLVRGLLTAGRYRLAIAALLPDERPVLVSHAGVTARELVRLGCAAEPRAIAATLDAQLAAAVAAADWAAERPLELAPLRLAGDPHADELPADLVQIWGRSQHPELSAPHLEADQVPLPELAALSG
jgi:hypothetical protein